MRKIVYQTLAILTFLLGSTGCATFLVLDGQFHQGATNPCDPPKYTFGGTATDIGVIIVSAKNQQESVPFSLLMFSAAAVDLPFSFVADTVVLPYTVSRDLSKCAE